MLHTTAASSWSMIKLSWTSSAIRNQRCTRVQIEVHYRSDFGFEFGQAQSIRMAVIPALPVDPSPATIRAELQARNERKRGNTSPTESEMPVKRRRGTQTTVQGNHLEKIPSM